MTSVRAAERTTRIVQNPASCQSLGSSMNSLRVTSCPMNIRPTKIQNASQMAKVRRTCRLLGRSRVFRVEREERLVRERAHVRTVSDTRHRTKGAQKLDFVT